MNPSINFEHVSKRYSLGKRRAFLRELLPDFLADHLTPDRTPLWALKDVSFEVMPGECFGIIGSNGSGKTTTLSLLAGVSAPTEGCLATRGTIGALIQLGAGFHPEFTGKENVYLNASILGLRRTQVDRIYREVVEFAELGPFMDTPVKRYSSGMYARLGFSVAVHTDPDILLVDEVLAVGDMTFQTRCVRRMQELVRKGRTVVFVSHNLNLVENVCNRAMWLSRGRNVQIGSASDVIRSYLDEMDRQMLAQSQEENRTQDHDLCDIQIERTVLRDSSGNEKAEFDCAEPLTVEIHYRALKRIQRPYFWIGIYSKSGPLFGASMLLDNERPEFLEDAGILGCTFRLPPLMPQVYAVRAGIRSSDGATLLIPSQQIASFRVTGDARSLNLTAVGAESLTRDTAAALIPYEWRLPDGQIRPVTFRSGEQE